jgi:hypothetical protein
MEQVNQGPQGSGVITRTLAAGVGLGAKATALTAMGVAFFLAPLPTIVAGATGMLGGIVGTFILHKSITRTQTANALRYSPLVIQNKPMIGGFPCRRLDNGFIQTILDKVAVWTKEAGEGMPLYIDHLSYKLSPNNWVNTMGTIKWL